MVPALALNWIACGRPSDGDTVPSGTYVKVRARNLSSPPTGFRIERVLPKPWWKFWGRTAEDVASLDVVKPTAGAQDPGGLYFSEDWQLPVPEGQLGYAYYRAWTASGEAYSGLLGSSRMWIQKHDSQSRGGGEVAGYLPVGAPAAAIVRSKASSKKVDKFKWEVRPAVDPPVRMRILQGGAVLHNLQAAEAELAKTIPGVQPGAMKDLPSDSMSYFDFDLLDNSPFEAVVGPDAPALVEVHLPLIDGLRAAIALEVVNLEDGSVTRSAPFFATNVGDRIVVTDVTIDMLRSEPRQILAEFVESYGDVDKLAVARNEPVSVVWDSLVGASDELGAESVGDAAALFAAMGERSPATSF